MSKEEFLLRHYPLLFSLDISALKTCLGSNNSRSLPEEVIANSPLTNSLHAWRLSQQKALASAHVLTTDDSLANFTMKAKLINECLHAYGIHSTTLQPELVTSIEIENGKRQQQDVQQRAGKTPPDCQINCGTLCEDLKCCN